MPPFSSFLKSTLVPTLVLGVAAQAAAQVAFRYTKTAFSYIRNAEVPAVIYDVRLDGGRLIIEITEPAQACCPESKVRMEIQAADLDLNSIGMKRYWDIGPDEPQSMRLSCRDERPCVTQDRGRPFASVGSYVSRTTAGTSVMHWGPQSRGGLRLKPARQVRSAQRPRRRSSTARRFPRGSTFQARAPNPRRRRRRLRRRQRARPRLTPQRFRPGSH